MSQWVGCAVSVKCADGTYQGEITSATNSDLILSKAFCNGIPCGGKVTILGKDILELKLIEKQAIEGAAERSTVTIAKPVAKRAGRSQSISENSNLNKSLNTSGRSKPIDIQTNEKANESQGSYKGGTPLKKDKSKKWGKGWKDEACFGSPLDHTFAKDFDFEKNLALFNKQAVFDEINAHKPDVVKNAEQRKPTKYRHDENIIATMPTTFRQITIPKQDFCEYVTDDGLIIPTITRGLRKKLWEVADRIGLGWERRIELMGRGTTEMTVQLLGGAHRLNPHNSHQAPTVIFFCGPNKQGAMGLNAARQLASQGVNTVVYLVSTEPQTIKHEYSLYKFTKNKIVNTISALPPHPDFIIVALCDDTENSKLYSNIADWVNNNKAPVLAIDPPAVGTPGISSKYSLVPVMPLLHSPENGRVYLCNLGFPLEIFYEVGIKYKSPFGPKFVIPLHPNNP